MLNKNNHRNNRVYCTDAAEVDKLVKLIRELLPLVPVDNKRTRNILHTTSDYIADYHRFSEFQRNTIYKIQEGIHK